MNSARQQEVVLPTPDPRFYLHTDSADRYPALHRLLRELNLIRGHSDGAIQNYHPSFAVLVRSGELEEILGEVLTRMSRSKDFQPNWISPRAEEWFIAESDGFALRAFALKPANDPTFSSLPNDCLVGNIGRAPIVFTHYRFPADLNLALFDQSLVLPQGSQKELRRGQSVFFRFAADIPDYAVPKATISVELSRKHYSPLLWVFERSTGSAVLCTSSYEAPVRSHAVAESLQYLAAELTQTSLEILVRLTTSRHHHVRWRALQSLCAIDFEFAKPHLLRACEDSHPIVAHAARKAVQQLRLP